jgi:hypothetical protein
MSRKVSAQFKSSSDAYMSAQSDLDAKSDPQLQAAQSKVDTVREMASGLGGRSVQAGSLLRTRLTPELLSTGVGHHEDECQQDA